MQPIRVLLADDHAAVRRSVRRLLARDSQIEVVGEAEDGVQALQLVEELHPDVLLLDVEMPGPKGYEVARHLFDQGSQVRVLVLSGYDDKRYVVEMMASGAAGYLSKEDAPSQLITAIHAVAGSVRRWISPRIVDKLRDLIPAEAAETRPVLTPADEAILEALIQGKSDRQIAQGLVMDEGAVGQKIASLIQELGVSSRREAALWALLWELGG